MEDYPDVDAYLAASELWPEAIRALRPVLLASGFDETVKWGKPATASTTRTSSWCRSSPTRTTPL
ncbi:MAG: hypothetical protein R3F59_13055 [Myxococcota bacterium]